MCTSYDGLLSVEQNKFVLKYTVMQNSTVNCSKMSKLLMISTHFKFHSAICIFMCGAVKWSAYNFEYSQFWKYVYIIIQTGGFQGLLQYSECYTYTWNSTNMPLFIILLL